MTFPNQRAMRRHMPRRTINEPTMMLAEEDQKRPAIVDLCDSDDDDGDDDDGGGGDHAKNNDDELIDLSSPTRNAAVARAPTHSANRPKAHSSTTSSKRSPSRKRRHSRGRDPIPQQKSPRRREKNPRFPSIALPAATGKSEPSSSLRNTARKKPPPSSDPPVEVVAVKKSPNSPMVQILEIFPDVQQDYARKLLKDMAGEVAMVLSVLSDFKYPRQEASDIHPLSSSLLGNGLFTLKLPPTPKYDYLAPSSFDPSPEYRQQASEQLALDFPFITCHAVSKWLKEANGHYSIVRERILDAIMGKNLKASMATLEDNEERWYKALKPVLAGVPLDLAQKSRLGEDNVLKKRRATRPTRNPISNPILEEEIVSAQQKLSQWMTSVEKSMQLKRARKESQQAGTAIECTCCYEDVAIEEMTHCDAGHMLCMGCLKNYAENQIFGSGSFGVDKVTKKPLMDLACCHPDGCDASFHDTFLQKALSEKALEKYNQLQFQVSVEKAGLKAEMCSCPKCGFQADLPDTQMIFECPIVTCQFHSCRKCNQESHIPLRCEEIVKQKKEDEGRLKVEEAITEAKIRTCPKCSTKFIKSDGCNKMSCSCSAKVCYVCRKDITKEGYQHFCQTPHCHHKNCKKCQLYSKAEEDDERAMREAGITAAQRYQDKLRNEGSNNGIGDVQIDVEGILKNPPGSVPPKRRHG